MSSATVFSAVRSFLTAAWLTTPLAWENEEFALPGEPAAWIKVEVYGDSYDQVSIGSGSPTMERWVEEGAVMLHVMVPQGTGSNAAREHAENLATLLRGLELPSNIRFTSMSIGLGDMGTEDGTYWRLSLRANWTRG